MPIEPNTLAAMAGAYVNAMTSIRGRRVHRLLLREFLRFDHVLPAAAEDGTPALLALSEDGGAAVCRTDGTGEAACVAEWPLQGATVTTSYDLRKDSLGVTSWMIWHPGFARVAGALTVSATGLSPSEVGRISELLRSWQARGGAGMSLTPVGCGSVPSPRRRVPIFKGGQT